MRLFVAAALDVKIREGVGDATGVCREHADVRSGSIIWIEPASLHLTLVFLGEVAPEAATEVQAILGRPWRQSAFWAALSGAGAFPMAGIPRVIWLGLGAGGAELRMLHAEVETRLEPLGFRPERGLYHAHLTIGRVKRVTPAVGAGIRDALRAVKFRPMRWLVDRVVLYESRLSSTGASYHVLTHTTLRHTEGR